MSTPGHVKSMNDYFELHNQALNEPAQFWLKYAEKFYWRKFPTQEHALLYNFDIRNGPIFVKWFADGETNICYNAVDRHIENGNGEKTAFFWEGNDPNDITRWTYSDLLVQVQKLGLALRSLGVGKGDRVALYMPMVPQLIISMLACTRIGAVHSVVFGGFSAPALANRIMDANCKVLITCDGTWRGSKLIDLYSNAATALQLCQEQGHAISTCIVLRHVTSTPNSTNTDREKMVLSNQIGIRPAKSLAVCITEGRDVWWHDLMSQFPDDCQCPVEWMNAEDPLFILYTSGSTGRPKGVLHTVGGYMVYVSTTFYYTFNYQNEDVYWCTADAGWITGHSYVVYGPMLNCATSVIFEGIPTWPNMSRCWAIIDRYQVTKFYTAPTAIRTLMAAGDSFVTAYKRTSLKVLGSVGEPINPSAWEWYHRVVGNGCCSVVDTFWQTETGGHMITPLPDVTPVKPGCATRPFFGVDVQILSDKGVNLSVDAIATGKSVEGYLVFGKPWPGMMRTVYGDHKRFESVYFSRFPGFYVTGDGAKMDEDGDIWITGRIDDMLNVSGHLVSTAEVESALLLHPRIAEAAVVSRIHPVKGECLHCFVTLKASSNEQSNGSVIVPESTGHDLHLDPVLRSELCQLIRKRIGPFVVPDHIQEARMLPKTRSGKVLRRLLRKIANQDFDFGDTSTLADQSCLDELVKMAQEA